jgi:hypothetical protein
VEECTRTTYTYTPRAYHVHPPPTHTHTHTHTHHAPTHPPASLPPPPHPNRCSARTTLQPFQPVVPDWVADLVARGGGDGAGDTHVKGTPGRGSTALAALKKVVALTSVVAALSPPARGRGDGAGASPSAGGPRGGSSSGGSSSGGGDSPSAGVGKPAAGPSAMVEYVRTAVARIAQPLLLKTMLATVRANRRGREADALCKELEALRLSTAAIGGGGDGVGLGRGGGGSPRSGADDGGSLGAATPTHGKRRAQVCGQGVWGGVGWGSRRMWGYRILGI